MSRAARGLSRRGIKGIWQHSRRVPVRYAQLEQRKLIHTSLHTQDYTLALAKAAQIELLQDQEWELALQTGTHGPSKSETYAKLKQIAEMRGVTYLPTEQIVHLPIDQICTRIEKTEKAPAAAPALLGAEQAPKVTTENWLETYESHITEKLENHSQEQRHRWHITRVRAVTRFVEALGNLPIEHIRRSHSLEFRKWWRDVRQ